MALHVNYIGIKRRKEEAAARDTWESKSIGAWFGGWERLGVRRERKIMAASLLSIQGSQKIYTWNKTLHIASKVRKRRAPAT